MDSSAERHTASEERKLGPVDLKKNSQIVIQQNGFIWEQQRISIQDMQSNGKSCAGPEDQGEENCFTEKRRAFRGAVVSKESPGGN